MILSVTIGLKSGPDLVRPRWLNVCLRQGLVILADCRGVVSMVDHPMRYDALYWVEEVSVLTCKLTTDC